MIVLPEDKACAPGARLHVIEKRVNTIDLYWVYYVHLLIYSQKDVHSTDSNHEESTETEKNSTDSLLYRTHGFASCNATIASSNQI